MTTLILTGLSAFLAVLGVSALLRKELGPFCLWTAPRLASWAAHRLPAPWDEIREEEWLETLDSMKDMRLFRLLWALGFCGASIKLQPHRATTTTPMKERQRDPFRPNPVVRRASMCLGGVVWVGIFVQWLTSTAVGLTDVALTAIVSLSPVAFCAFYGVFRWRLRGGSRQ